MKNIITILILIIIGYFFIQYKNVEHMCQIQYPVCDNYCQRAKLDLCAQVSRYGYHPPHCNY